MIKCLNQSAELLIAGKSRPMENHRGDTGSLSPDLF